MSRMAWRVAPAAACLLLLACGGQESSSDLVVSNVTVISPERAAPLERAYVRIRDGRIAEVSERPLHGAVEIDGTGRYLVPGLIDSHVHLAVAPGFPAGMTGEHAAAHREIVAAALVQDPRSYLFYGFTTVVDLVGTGERMAQWNAYEVRPDAYFCGAAATIAGQIRLVRFPYFSYDAPPEERIPPAADLAQHTPEAVVARIAEDGAICLKTIYEEGLTQTVEEGRALVAAAHERGLPVFIHANRKEGQAFAVAAGVDVIVHGMWRDSGEEAALDEEAREILAAIAREGIGYQPTTQVIMGLYDILDEDYLDRSELADAYPRVLIEWYASGPGASTAYGVGDGDSAAEARLRETIGRATEVTALLADVDARLLFGSDTPSDRLYTNPPGLNGRLEMDNWISAGVSEEKLFHALTLDNVRAVGLDGQIGTVEAGKVANLLLLRADPLASVDAYDTIETVFLHGRPIQRQFLSARNPPGNQP